jgi:xylulokinase
LDKETLYVIAYDIGSTSNKTCLYAVSEGISLLAEAVEKYPLSFVDNGGVEQNPDDWWNSMRLTTPAVLKAAGLRPEQIAAVSFCAQMQGLVLVDKNGEFLRPAMSYMDKRASVQHGNFMNGLIRIAGMNARRALISLKETGVVAASVKDPVFRYAWVRENESDVFARIHKWLDVKDYLICRMTGRYVSSEDSAFAAMLYDHKHHRWSRAVCKLHGVNMAHLAEIVPCTGTVGKLTEAAAKDLSLTPACTVFAGGGDSSMIGIGAGSTRIGDTHVYFGTSGWVSTIVDKSIVDAISMIASVVGACPGRYNYFAEMETAGKCLEWVRDNVVLDGIGAYGSPVRSEEELIGYMCSAAEKAPPGSNGVLFMPWLLGNRCPFEDADCRGGFFNISLTTKKVDLVRAVLEGILLHIRWMLESQMSKIATSPVLRMVGGGARSPVLCQILADITGRSVESVKKPQNAGTMGAAVLMAYGLGRLASLDDASCFIQADVSYTPSPEAAKIYDKIYPVFKRLHGKNRKNFRMLNG